MTKGDHKRKAPRTLAPADVRCGDGWIEVVVPDVLGKNESHTAGKGGARHTSAATKRYRMSVAHGVTHYRQITAETMADVWKADAHDGAWRLEVLGVWPRENHTAGFKPCPKGDADAAIPQALDALQHAGILDDDARVVEVRAWNLYRKDVRCTVIRLVRVDDLDTRDAAIAHLVQHVPASPMPPPKAPRKVAKKPRIKFAKPRKETP